MVVISVQTPGMSKKRFSGYGKKNEALPLCNGNGPLTEISLFGKAIPNGRRLKNMRKWFVHEQQYGFSHLKKKGCPVLNLMSPLWCCYLVPPNVHDYFVGMMMPKGALQI